MELLDRRKATQVLSEIFDNWKEKTPMQGYSVNGSGSGDGDYELRLIMPSGKDFVDCLKPILERHGLSMKQAKGFLIIYTPQNP